MSFYLENQIGRSIIYHENGTCIGELILDVDGFYAWWPPKDMRGCLPESAINYIHCALIYLNFQQSAAIDEYFRKEAVNCNP